MKNVGCIIAIFFSVGIIEGYAASYYNLDLSYVFVISAALFTSGLFIIYKQRKDFSVMLLSVFVILGFIRSISYMRPSNGLIENFAENGDVVKIRAVVYDKGKEYDGKYTLFLQSESISKGNYIIDENIGIKAVFKDSEIFSVGDEIEFSGKLVKINAAKNPGGFNEWLYYKLRDTEYKFYPENPVKIGENRNYKILLKKLNQKVSKVYDNVLPKKEAAVIKAMITGDKSDLSDFIKDLFSNAGIYHIVVVSGLHIHMLAGIVLFFAERVHKRYGKILAAIFIIAYCIFTGAGVSSVRAASMFLIYIFGKLFYREYDVKTSLFVSGFLILLFKPLYLFDVGFQYSFGAVLSLVIFSEPAAKLLCKIFDRRTADVLSAAVSVNFIPKAIVWYNFFSISTLDILANIIVIPFSGIVIFFGFIIGILGLLSINAAAFLSGAAYIIIKFYEMVCRVISDIPFSYILLGKPDLFQIIMYLAAVFAAALYLYKRVSGKFLIYFIIIAVLTNLFSVGKRDELKITMLDVGQGDCFVFNYDGGCFIIDGGGNYDMEIGDGTGENILYPYLKYMGADYADAIFVSHSDADHIKGIIEILDYIGAGKIYVSNKNDGGSLYKTLREKAKSKNIDICEIHFGAEINLKNEIYIDCIYPYNSDKIGNDASLVLKVRFKNTSFLFTGDISAESEKEIIDSDSDIKADVLKLSHHGSKYSNCSDFISEVNPKLAIVSAGSYKIYKHPSKDVEKEFQRRNITLLNTREKGAVEIYSDGENIYYETMK